MARNRPGCKPSTRGVSEGLFVFRLFGFDPRKFILGQLRDAGIRQAHCTIDVMGQRLAQRLVFLAEAIEYGAQFVQQF